MKKILMLTIFLLSVSTMAVASNEYIQKDGLFKMYLLDGWTSQEVSGRIYILPPPPVGGGVVINFEPVKDAASDEELTKMEFASERNIESNIKAKSGNILEKKEILINHVSAKYLYYTLSLKSELMYFFDIILVNKGRMFRIDYGNNSKDAVEKVFNVVKSLNFEVSN